MAREYPGSTLWEYTSRRFGAPTRVVDRVKWADTFPRKILENNPRRMAWLIVNSSSVSCVLGFSSEIEYDAGILCGSGGGSIACHADEDGELTCWEVWAKTSVGAAKLYVVEVVAE